MMHTEMHILDNKKNITGYINDSISVGITTNESVQKKTVCQSKYPVLKMLTP